MAGLNWIESISDLVMNELDRIKGLDWTIITNASRGLLVESVSRFLLSLFYPANNR
jgi:hypothetical protein